MSSSPNDTLYDFTSAVIVCSVTVSKNIDTPLTVTWEWFSSPRLSNGTEYSISGDTLRINRISLTRDHNRNLTCIGTVVPSSYYVIQYEIVSSTSQLKVEGECILYTSVITETGDSYAYRTQ